MYNLYSVDTYVDLVANKEKQIYNTDIKALLLSSIYNYFICQSNYNNINPTKRLEPMYLLNHNRPSICTTD